VWALLFNGFTGPLELALRLAGKASYLDDGAPQRVA
jgi:hypothetical protein